MTNKIKILHLEDSLRDSELIHSFIENGEISHDYFLADNEKDFSRILETEKIDIILSDYNLPGYSGSEALQLASKKYENVPFLFVSGKIGEDTAITAMLNGATDYVFKNKLERLVPAINRAMNEHELVIKRIQSEKNIKEKNILIEAQYKKYIKINKELELQNREREKRAAELIIANKELAFQNQEKEKRAAELIIANNELIYQNEEKEKRAGELVLANDELVFQNREKEKRADEYSILNDELTQSINHIQNINSELIISRNNAEESDRLKSAFLANMSHEIRTPLNSIMGFSEFLLEPGLSDKNQKEFVQIINSSSQQLLSIISDIMDISKIEAGRFSIDFEIVNIDELMNELFVTYEKLIDSSKIRLTYLSEIQNKPIYVKTDGTRIRQAICNLLNNAIKFTKEGEIQFGYTIQKNQIEFYVKDNGIGIASENLTLIFERFRQVEATNQQLNNGNGLGLSISKALVEKLGGTIHVDSELGKGSNFIFTIPYDKGSENKVNTSLPTKSGSYNRETENIHPVGYEANNHS